MDEILSDIGHLVAEVGSLEARMSELSTVIEAEKFKELPTDYRSVIGAQFLAMAQYLACLKMRQMQGVPAGFTLKLTDELDEQPEPAA